jgi:hypothetical protein
MIQKVGSGVPAGGQLKRGELGLDLDSNTIYSSSNGADIVVMGISEINWEDINNFPDFILNIDPNVPGYIDITDLEGRVEVNENDIAALKNIVIPENGDSLADLIAANAAAIAENEAAIGVNAGAISTNSGLIQDNADDIAALKGQINDPDGLADQVAENTSNISINAGGISQNAADILALQNALEGEITGLTLGGTYDAENNEVLSVTTEGTAAGLVVGSNLPSSADCKGIYVIVEVGGELSGTGGTASEASAGGKSDGQTAYPGDWLVSDGIHGWILFGFHTDQTLWGMIGGEVTNQTDLMEYLAATYLAKDGTIDGGTYVAVRRQ